MVAQTIIMPRKPTSPKSTEQYRKPARMVRVRERLAQQGELLAERLAKDLTEIVNDALRVALEKEGLWPPTQEGGD